MACTSDIEPPRFTGDERSTSTLTPTSTSWVADPAQRPRRRTSPTVGARPTPISTATPTAAPSSTLRRGPMRSTPDPTRRAVSEPRHPQPGEHQPARAGGQREVVLQPQRDQEAQPGDAAPADGRDQRRRAARRAATPCAGWAAARGARGVPGMPTTASSRAHHARTPRTPTASRPRPRAPPTSGAEVWPAACIEPNQPSARPSRSGGHGARERREQQRGRERVRDALQRPAAEEHRERGRQRAEQRRRRVRDVGDAHRPLPAPPLPERARHHLQRRERQQVGRDRHGDVARRDAVRGAELRQHRHRDAAAERADERARVEPALARRAGEAVRVDQLPEPPAPRRRR